MTDGDKFVDLPRQCTSRGIGTESSYARTVILWRIKRNKSWRHCLVTTTNLSLLQQSQKSYLASKNINLHRVCTVSWLITTNMETSVEKIAKLEADIEELKAKRNSTSNEVLQIAITNEITTIRVKERIRNEGSLHIGDRRRDVDKKWQGVHTYDIRPKVWKVSMMAGVSCWLWTSLLLFGQSLITK